VVLPYAWLSGSADVEGQPWERDVSGLADPRLLNRYTSIKLYGSTGVSTRTGSDFDAGDIVVQYRWGGGL
jgi:hypothetical protein